MAFVCDNGVDKPCVKMLLVTYESFSKNAKTGYQAVALPSAAADKQAVCPGLARIDKASHDFRSLLNIVIGYSELMLDGVLGKITEEQSEGIKDILSSSRHMLELVNDLNCRPKNRA